MFKQKAAAVGGRIRGKEKEDKEDDDDKEVVTEMAFNFRH